MSWVVLVFQQYFIIYTNSINFSSIKITKLLLGMLLHLIIRMKQMKYVQLVAIYQGKYTLTSRDSLSPSIRPVNIF